MQTKKNVARLWPGWLAAWILLTFSAAAQTTAGTDAALAEEIAALRERIAAQEKQLEQLRAALAALSDRMGRAAPAPIVVPAPAAQGPAQKAPPATAELVAGSGYERLRFRNAYLSPGGFVEAVTLFRSTNQNADLGSTFGGIALAGTANSRLSEFRGSARQSRLSLLAETEVGKIKASGYFETDFLGAAPTANEIESNSFQPRLRQFWGQVDLPGNFSLTAGQTWSLLTTHRKGLRPRSEFIPLTIDAQYGVGYNWARQLEFRLTKGFGKNTWAAFAVANPETAIGGVVLPAGALGFGSSANAQSPSSQFTTSATPGAAGVSTDVAPDLIAKIVFEPGWGHWELKALGRFFRSRLNERNHSALGGGVGAAAILPVYSKLDWIVETLAGSGIGRYAAAIGPDVVVRPDGSLQGVRAIQSMTGLEWHPASAWDVYNYAGLEYYHRVSIAGASVGYGSRAADLSACAREVPRACPQANRVVWQLQPGFWYRFHRGKEGAAALGMSYSYTWRQLWSGAGGLKPKGVENIVMLGVRYYLP